MILENRLDLESGLLEFVDLIAQRNEVGDERKMMRAEVSDRPTVTDDLLAAMLAIVASIDWNSSDSLSQLAWVTYVRTSEMKTPRPVTATRSFVVQGREQKDAAGFKHPSGLSQDVGTVCMTHRIDSVE